MTLTKDVRRIAGLSLRLPSDVFGLGAEQRLALTPTPLPLAGEGLKQSGAHGKTVAYAALGS